MTRAEFIDYYIEKSLDPEFELDIIRKELELKNIDKDEIAIIVRIVDNDIHARVLEKSSNSKASELIWIGAFLTIAGAGLTIGTFLGFIDTGNNFVIAYGPFFGGISTLVLGLSQRRKNNK